MTSTHSALSWCTFRNEAGTAPELNTAELKMLLPEVRLVGLWQTVTCHPQGLKPLVRVRHTETTQTHTQAKYILVIKAPEHLKQPESTHCVFNMILTEPCLLTWRPAATRRTGQKSLEVQEVP